MIVRGRYRTGHRLSGGLSVNSDNVYFYKECNQQIVFLWSIVARLKNIKVKLEDDS
jgi:hypothetical protein